MLTAQPLFACRLSSSSPASSSSSSSSSSPPHYHHREANHASEAPPRLLFEASQPTRRASIHTRQRTIAAIPSPKLSSVSPESASPSPTTSSPEVYKAGRPSSACSLINSLFEPTLRRFSDINIRRSRSKTELSVQRDEFYDLSSEEDNNELHVPGRKSRSASITSSSSAPASHELTLHVPAQSNSTATSPTPSTGSANYFIVGMFDGKERVNRDPPPMPTTDGVEYPRAASWAAGNCANVLNDEKGRQLFRVFLFQSLAEENLSFLEAMEKLKKMKSSEEKTVYAKEILDTYQSSINLSSSSMKSLRNAVASEMLDMEEFAPAIKEVKRLLENDQFPRFRRSELYLDYLEELLPRSYADKWAQSFESLLGNHVGRHHFRLFLRGIHAEENLRFWEAVVEFRSSRHKLNAMTNLGKVILNTYLAEGTANEVFLPFGVRQVIERRIQDGEIDITLFDEAIKHVEQVLRNDPYVRFLQSTNYINLLNKLK